MLTLRTNGYTEQDLVYLQEWLEQVQWYRFDKICHDRRYEKCTSCQCKRACDDLIRLKLHVETLLSSK